MGSSIGVLVVGGAVFCGSFITFIWMVINQVKKSKNMDENGNSNGDKEEKELIPVQYYDTKNQCFSLDDGSNMDLFKINTKDINSASDDEKAWDNMRFAKFYRTYGEDIKYITLNFPCDTKLQQEYWKHKIEITKNEKLRELQRQRLFQLEWLEKNNTSREFYLMYFGKDIETLHKNRMSILSVLSTGKDGLVEELQLEKKIQIFYKLANKSSQITVH